MDLWYDTTQWVWIYGVIQPNGYGSIYKHNPGSDNPCTQQRMHNKQSIQNTLCHILLVPFLLLLHQLDTMLVLLLKFLDGLFHLSLLVGSSAGLHDINDGHVHSRWRRGR